MAVPEATVHEDHPATPRKHQVGPSRQTGTMQPVSVAKPVSQSAHDKLGPRVLSPDPAHALTALGRGKRVHAYAGT